MADLSNMICHTRFLVNRKQDQMSFESFFYGCLFGLFAAGAIFEIKEKRGESPMGVIKIAMLVSAIISLVASIYF
ncbi:hypothetical protein ACFVXE_08430 [Streptomyces sp. NPDC058231]|uniref:hypothetical protein n=1 Tax=Streptomyces sp. NPDC058231 TaxID=3346392 RepID=UPI0036F0ACA8